ncbi:hypothetical protein ACF3NR_00440 [Vaginella massiliensis]|uniref:hypothetical protein n=1 Tax=Vaginella massiliensis TaxID=1816680 RepID=UPI0037526405
MLTCASAQVVIGDIDYENDHAILSLINPSSNKEKAKGLMLPIVDSISLLPLYDATQPDFFKDDPSMEGMIMYVKENETVMVYDGEKWKTTLYHSYTPKTRASMQPGTSIDVVCVLVVCNTASVPFHNYSESDIDELEIIDPKGEGDTFSNFTIKEKGIYKVMVSLGIKTSGLHVSSPLLAFVAKKADYVIATKDVPIADALLIHAGANRVGVMEFMAMFDEGDVLSLDVKGAVSIATVADVYTIVPGERTYIQIEKID